MIRHPPCSPRTAPLFPYTSLFRSKPALLQRFAGRDDLDHRRMARIDVARNARDRARRLHRGDEMIEEALLGALERRARRRFRLRVERAMLGARYSGRLHRRGEIVVDDLKGGGEAIVDPP